MNLALVLFIVIVSIFIAVPITIATIMESKNKSINDFLAAVLMIAWSIFCFGSGVTIQNEYEDTISYTEEQHMYHIHSLGNDKYTEGNFGLFTGEINDVDYYFYFVNYTTGMRRNKLPISKTYLIEGDYRPKVVAVYKKYRDEDRFWKVWDEYEPEYYKIYVPKNTIVRDFKVR